MKNSVTRKTAIISRIAAGVSISIIVVIGLSLSSDPVPFRLAFPAGLFSFIVFILLVTLLNLPAIRK